MNRLLISNNHLADFGGSEMVTLELAEEFAARGWSVDVYTNYVGAPFEQEFTPLVDSGLVRIIIDPSDALPLTDYSLLWVHHNLMPEPIIEGLTEATHPPIVWNHMSAMPGLESPLIADIEDTVSTAITHNSPESGAAILNYGLTAAKARLFPNPAPRAFAESSSKSPVPHKLQRIAFISNHPPEEVLLLRTLLEVSGIEVISIGGGSPQRVTPDSFREIDAVLSIGKSVQYALCLGLPAFVYDHFGGSGWLTSENFETERKFNFSGRSSRRKLTADELLAELLGGFAGAAEFARESRAKHCADFSLRSQIDDLLRTVNRQRLGEVGLTAAQAQRWTTFVELQRTRTREQRAAWAWQMKLVADVDELRADTHSLAEQATYQESLLRHAIETLAAENDALRGSKSYRLGNALIAPVKRFIQR